MDFLDRQPVKPGEKWLVVTDSNTVDAADPHYDQQHVQTFAEKEEIKKDRFRVKIRSSNDVIFTNPDEIKSSVAFEDNRVPREFLSGHEQPIKRKTAYRTTKDKAKVDIDHVSQSHQNKITKSRKITAFATKEH